MIWTLLAALAFGAPEAPPTCAPLTPQTDVTTSVAWVSPVGRKLLFGGRIPVVRTTDLAAWVQLNDQRVGRMLQGMGLRKKATRPKRAWKVTVLEVPRTALCRPVAEATPGSVVDGVAVCDKNEKGVPGLHGGCGHTIDRADDSRGLDLFRVRWRDASAAGFCVLPAERFVQGR